MAMVVDDSFKKPGAVPFKWEIRPGVPKIQYRHVQEIQPKQLSPPTLPSPAEPFYHHRSSPFPRPKLKPPPAGSIFLPSPEPRTRSFRSAPRIRSERWHLEHPARVRAEYVSSGCFPSPLLKRKESKRRSNHRGSGHESETDYSSELETYAWWSLSSRRSVSSSRESPRSTYYSSCQSSPRVVSDAEWAGYGLF